MNLGQIVWVLIGEDWTGDGTDRRVLSVHSSPELANAAVQDHRPFDSYYVESHEVDG